MTNEQAKFIGKSIGAFLATAIVFGPPIAIGIYAWFEDAGSPFVHRVAGVAVVSLFTLVASVIVLRFIAIAIDVITKEDSPL